MKNRVGVEVSGKEWIEKTHKHIVWPYNPLPGAVVVTRNEFGRIKKGKYDTARLVSRTYRIKWNLLSKAIVTITGKCPVRPIALKVRGILQWLGGKPCLIWNCFDSSFCKSLVWELTALLWTLDNNWHLTWDVGLFWNKLVGNWNWNKSERNRLLPEVHNTRSLHLGNGVTNMSFSVKPNSRYTYWCIAALVFLVKYIFINWILSQLNFFLRFRALGRVVEFVIARAQKDNLKIDLTRKTYSQPHYLDVDF